MIKLAFIITLVCAPVAEAQDNSEPATNPYRDSLCSSVQCQTDRAEGSICALIEARTVLVESLAAIYTSNNDTEAAELVEQLISLSEKIGAAKQQYLTQVKAPFDQHVCE